VGSGSWVAGMDGGAFDQMVAPDSGEEKWPGDGAADSAWVVLYSEFTEMLWADTGGFWPSQRRRTIIVGFEVDIMGLYVWIGSQP
jgi:hypothetical protein